MSFIIEVVFPEGQVGYCRHGARIGEGEIVRFATRKEAQDQVAFMKMGMEEGEDYESIAVVPWRRGLPKVDEA